MASRKRRGKPQKLTKEQKQARKDRNVRRKRTPAAVQWSKSHVVREPAIRGVANTMKRNKSKRQRMVEAAAQALKKMPAVDDSRVGRGKVIPNTKPVGRKVGDR